MNLITSKTTSIFILAIIAIIFGYDAVADALGFHATISEYLTNKQAKYPRFATFLWLAIGIFIGHILFSVNYNQ